MIWDCVLGGLVPKWEHEVSLQAAHEEEDDDEDEDDKQDEDDEVDDDDEQDEDDEQDAAKLRSFSTLSVHLEHTWQTPGWCSAVQGWRLSIGERELMMRGKEENQCYVKYIKHKAKGSMEQKLLVSNCPLNTLGVKLAPVSNWPLYTHGVKLILVSNCPPTVRNTGWEEWSGTVFLSADQTQTRPDKKSDHDWSRATRTPAH